MDNQPETPLEPSLFLRACRGESTPSTPIWIMRQAGRVLKPYRDLRAQHESIQTLFTTPDLAAEITLMPIELLDVDAAILFTDLVTPLGPLGSPFTYAPGPVFSSPIRSRQDLDQLRIVDPETDLDYVMKTIDLVCSQLPKHIPLIGYAGSPFTLATWLVEGRSAKDFPAFRAMMFNDPTLAHDLLSKLTDLVISFLKAQVHHGAQAIQIFDTSVGVLSPAAFADFVLPYLQRINSELEGLGVPRIYFPLGAAHSQQHFAHVGSDVLSIDWRLDIDQVYQMLGQSGVIQGNLDPCVLYAHQETIESEVQTTLNKVAGRPHIFNLGHGLQPDMPYENVRFLVDAVHRLSSS
jgi:uroporphyrinogen decarboxylase